MSTERLRMHSHICHSRPILVVHATMEQDSSKIQNLQHVPTDSAQCSVPYRRHDLLHPGVDRLVGERIAHVESASEEACLLGRAVLEQHHRVFDGHEAVVRALLPPVSDTAWEQSKEELTLTNSSLVDGLWMMPVSSSENFFCALALYSSTESNPCFTAMAGDSL